MTEASVPFDRPPGSDRAAGWDAFESLYRDCEANARTLILVIIGTPNDVEDVLHDAAIKAARRIGDIKQNPHAWFRTVVANTARDHMRSCRRQPRRANPAEELIVLLNRAAPSIPAHEHALYRDVLNYIYNNLSNRQREATLLVYLLGLTYEEAASHIGCTTNSLGVALNRAKAKIQKHYDIDLYSQPRPQEQAKSQGSGA